MATVRIFAYSELVVASIRPTAGRPITEGLFLLREPYLGNETLTPSTSVADNSDADNAPEDTKLLRVQVNGADQVYYEVTPANQTLRVATSNSPVLSGEELLNFGEGWRISFLEVT